MPSQPDADPDDELPPDRPLRGILMVFALVATCVVVAAIALPTAEARAKAPGGLDAASAEATVRQFIDEAVVQGNGYAACAYLTAAEQAVVARLGGPGADCRAVLGSDVSLLGVTTAGDLRGIRMQTTIRGSTARVDAERPGHPSVTFVLTPTTAADKTVFDAPSAPWRIAAGATQVVPAQG